MYIGITQVTGTLLTEDRPALCTQTVVGVGGMNGLRIFDTMITVL